MDLVQGVLFGLRTGLNPRNLVDFLLDDVPLDVCRLIKVDIPVKTGHLLLAQVVFGDPNDMRDTFGGRQIPRTVGYDQILGQNVGRNGPSEVPVAVHLLKSRPAIAQIV